MRDDEMASPLALTGETTSTVKPSSWPIASSASGPPRSVPPETMIVAEDELCDAEPIYQDLLHEAPRLVP